MLLRIIISFIRGLNMPLNRTLVAFSAAVLAAALTLPALACASEPVRGELRYEEGHFVPQQLIVPANQPLKIKVINAAAQPIEFESFELNRERVVPPGGEITVYLPSLSAGSYNFFDDFNRDATHGTLVAK
jgi:Cupredoxin-like domain